MTIRPLLSAVVCMGYALHAHGADSPGVQPESATLPFVLPPLAELDPTLAQPMVETIKEIHLQGATVLTSAEIVAVTAQYIGRPLQNHELNSLREDLSQLYLSKGFINSGVTYPDQSITGGKVNLQAIEGTLGEILIVSPGRLNAEYARARLALDTRSILNIQNVSNAIKLLQSDERIQRVNAQLLPQDQPGRAQLRIDIEEEQANRFLKVSADNYRSESIGAERAGLSFGHRNLLGLGDTLSLSFDLSEGAETGAFAYALPIAANRITTYANRSDADIVEAPFSDLDIESLTDTFGIKFEVPVFESLTESLQVTAGFEYRQSTSKLFGERFSLAPGAVNGDSDVRVGWAGVDWVKRSNTQVLALRATLRRGFDIWGATRKQPGAVLDTDGEFLSFVGQGQFVQQLGSANRLVVRSLIQLANEPLLALEKLAIGGRDTVRGYRENFIVRDNGWALSAELSRQVLSNTGFPGNLSLAVFSDWGQSWDRQDTAPFSNRNTEDKRAIASLGAGLRWQPVQIVMAELYYGEDIYDNFKNDYPRSGITSKGLQDDCLHFEVSITHRF